MVSGTGTPVHLKPVTHALVLFASKPVLTAPASSTQPTTRVFKVTNIGPLRVLSTDARPVRTFCASRSEDLPLLTRRSRKEVIQPQVPLRLPCYDFAPVTELAFGRSVP